MIRYLSVCSGIEAATVAWHPLGWTPAAFSEIEAFPRAVLKHHYPDVPLHGDFTTIGADEYGPIDLLVGGTPCQSFSVAGLRGGMADERGQLALQFLRLADRTRARWVVWENVPGVLSSNGGRDFGSFLGGLVELGYGFAYRILDAQHFGVPQRRRRVFVVGYLGDWRRAAAVLFERHSLSGDTPPRREKGQAAPTIPSRSTAGGGLGTDFDCDGGLVASTGDISHCLNAGGMGRQDFETETLIASIQERAVSDNPAAGPDGAGFRTDGQAYTLEARTVPQAVCINQQGGKGFGGHETELSPTLGADSNMHAVCFTAKDYGADASDISPTLRAGGHSGSHANAGVMPAVAIPLDIRQTSRGETLTNSGRSSNPLSGSPGLGVGKPGDPAHTLGQAAGGVFAASAVRRLTPRECERLQGFPDDWTKVPYRGRTADECADGPRYKSLGNSMAVPVMRWIGERIAMVEALSMAEAA